MQNWSQEHFKQISFFIQERGRWVIAPIETTLADLRQDFYELAIMLIKGNYGEFHWQFQIDRYDHF